MMDFRLALKKGRSELEMPTLTPFFLSLLLLIQQVLW